MPETRQMTSCMIFSWDEIIGDTVPLMNRDKDDNSHEIPYGLTDDEIVAKLRMLNGDEDEDEDEDEDDTGWTLAGIARTPRTAIVEWKSDRGHVATTTLIWYLNPL